MPFDENGRMISAAQAKRRLTGIPLESEEQQALFEWANLMRGKHPELDYLCHVPNGGLRNAVVAARLKAEGTRKGYPDILLDVARKGYHGLRIELKRVKGGRVSPEQTDWIDFLNGQGFLARVCCGWDAARELIEWYLGE